MHDPIACAGAGQRQHAKHANRKQTSFLTKFQIAVKFCVGLDSRVGKPQLQAQPQAPTEQSSESVIPALLIKKGGDYPPFWDRDNSFIEAMEAYYLALRKNGQKLL